MAKPLEREFRYFLDHQDELVEKYNGEFVVIKDNQVLGHYSDRATAIKETSKKHKLGTFLVQICEPGEDSYTAVFHSRIAIF